MKEIGIAVQETQAGRNHGKLCQVEIVLAQGGSAAEACNRIAVGERALGFCPAPGMAAGPQYQWRKDFGGLKTHQARDEGSLAGC